MINVALIGCGHWGKNYINTIRNIPNARLKYVYDIKKPDMALPEGTIFAQDLKQILEDEEISGIMVVTPTTTHYDLALKIIESGKNILVEKPLTTNSMQAKELCEAADRKGIILMVGHIFKYNRAIREIKKKIDEGEIGDLRYIESRRIALGPIRQDTSALWDLITHDVYIATYLIGKMPYCISCVGKSHNKKVDDIVSLNIKFPDDIFVTIYANWEHPIKERKIIIGGTKKAILFDDVEISNKIVIYDRGVDYQATGGGFEEFHASIRNGDILIPKLKIGAPLDEEIKHFINCI